MKSIATDTDNDIYLDPAGNLAVAEGLEAARNIALCAARTNYKEIPLDTERGIPYLDVIFGEHPNIGLFMQFLVQELEQLEFVRGVSDFASRVEGSTLKYNITIETEYGETEING